MLNILEKYSCYEHVSYLWHEYINDLRKGKIPEKPDITLINTFLKSSISHANHLNMIHGK